MSIYTRTGDKGTTSLFGGQRLLKSDPLIEAFGSIDELSSLIGLAAARISKKELRQLLTIIQKDLYEIMASLSGKKLDLKMLAQQVVFFEQIIDRTSLQLPKLTGFILPQGSETSGWLHFLRAVCRRTERTVVKLLKNQSSHRYSLPITIKYLNRLSDLFFVLARKHNQKKEVLI